MKAKIENSLNGIWGGLDMLVTHKMESMSALAEISIILSNPEIEKLHQVSEDLNPFLEAIHFLLRDLNEESVSLLSTCVDDLRKDKSNVIDYKAKYQETLEQLVSLQEQLLKKQKLA